MARIQARIQNTRSARFKAALALAGMSQKDFIDQLGDAKVERQHFHAVLSKKRESKKLTDIIDSFIEKMERAAAR